MAAVGALNIADVWQAPGRRKSPGPFRISRSRAR